MSNNSTLVPDHKNLGGGFMFGFWVWLYIFLDKGVDMGNNDLMQVC